MKKAIRTCPFAGFVLSALITLPLLAAAQTSGTLLHAPEASKLLPDAVFFAGKTATTQLRNSAGIHFTGDHYVLAVLVDTSGYSSTVQQKYQAYLFTEVPLSIGGHALPPGAYGTGFLGGHFLVMDIGNHTLLEAPAAHDAQMQRPTPLQILDGSAPGSWRLCYGRDCVDFRAKQR
ncbi:MAG TPA: hypothetical protein VHX37_16180 [Acidobacteriaceae bacterium]|jgi:hypothetical protein|nr:hypothetical protein [Acidobacteriaceae bacterium]